MLSFLSSFSPSFSAFFQSLSPLVVSLGLVFLSALGLSLGHCVGMCGGIVLAYSSIKRADLFAHSVYSLGRLCSYVGIGVLFALCGKAFALHHLWREFAGVGVGLLLIGYAVCYAFFPRILQLFQPRAGALGFFTRAFRALLASPSRWSFFGLGLLNGLLPCGLVYFYALYTLNEQILGLTGALGAVCVMSAFWLGTLASMLGLGLLGGALRIRGQWRWLSFCLMLGLGLWSIVMGVDSRLVGGV